MNLHPRLRALIWIAMLAIVLAPVVTRATATWSAAASPWDEICTTLGLKKAPAHSSERSSEQATKPADAPAAAEQGIARFLFYFISVLHPAMAPESVRWHASARVA